LHNTSRRFDDDEIKRLSRLAAAHAGKRGEFVLVLVVMMMMMMMTLPSHG